MLKQTLSVAIGGAIGTLIRFGIMSFFHTKQRSESSFPTSTIIVNLLGCFLIGLLYAQMSKSNISENTKLFLATGLLGGLTTFSTFALDIVMLIQNHKLTNLVLYCLLSAVGGIGSLYLGYKLNTLIQGLYN